MLTMYTTVWCGYCRRLKSGLDREGISYTEVDIEVDESAADVVVAANGGNRTVPTLVFADGGALTNPSVEQVKTRLADLADLADRADRADRADLADRADRADRAELAAPSEHASYAAADHRR
jgi:mycoredoxin